MGFEFEKQEYYNDEKDNCSTPKLCLYNTFPSKKREPLGMLTPPLRSFASIPFKWEEAPGKPRTTAAAGASNASGRSSILPKSKTVRCLVPPPRLMNIGTSKVTNMPSPTTVLDEPYSIGRSVSSSGGRSPEGQGGDSKERFSFSSSSCRRSSKESRGNGPNRVKGIVDISSVVENTEDKVKNSTTRRRRIRRRSNSFLIVSATSSKVLSSIYESFKQAVPWKRMPEKPRKG